MQDETGGLWAASTPEAYDRWLGPVVFRPFARDLVRRARAFGPGRVLEVAAGTGVVTRELVDSLVGADIIATDLNPGMVEFGSRAVPEAAWQRVDALDLPFDDGQFDLVVCQFGVMFFPDKHRAFSEARRVLVSQGRFVFSTWDTVDSNDFGAALLAGLEDAFPEDPPRQTVLAAHGYSDVAVIAEDLGAAGLECLSAERVTVEGQASSAADVATGFCTGTPVRVDIEARGDAAAAMAAIVARMQARLGAGHVRGRMSAHVITGAAASP